MPRIPEDQTIADQRKVQWAKLFVLPGSDFEENFGRRLSDPDFKALAVQMRKISDILTIPTVLTKKHHAGNPAVFRQIITLLESLNCDNGTRFTTMTVRI